MYCVFSYGRRVLSSGSIVKVRLFEAWPKRPLLGKYFTINGQIDLDESPRGHNAKKGQMSRAILLEWEISGGKGGTVVWNQTVKALCYPSMCLMGSVAERSKALV